MVDTKKKASKTKKKKTFNISSVMLMPMLGKAWYWWSKHTDNFYMGDNTHPEYNNHIFCALRNEPYFESFTDMTKVLQEHGNYVTHYDLNDELVMYCFSVPEEYQEDYELIKQGKYSKLSDLLKNAILGREESGLNYEVLTRSPRLRARRERELGVTIDKDAELLDPPFPNREIYNYD